MTQIRYTILDETLCEGTADLISICFPDMPPEDQMSTKSLQRLAALYPEGVIIALAGSQVVGMGSGILMDIDLHNLPATEHNLLYRDGKSSHDPDGAYYYGSNLAVHPDFRGLGIAREIYRRRKAIVTDNNKRGFYAAAVLPGYADHKGQMDIHSYVNRVVDGTLFDSTLSVQLRNGFQVVRLIHNFFVFPKSDNWSALIYWENTTYATS